jgi:endoglycosylceramidase
MLPGNFIVITIAALLIAAAAPAPAAPISVNSRQRLVDGAGREVYFHGANMVTKSHPYLPTTAGFDVNTSFVADDMRLFQRLGLNGLRLGNMWPGAEPSRGRPDAGYHTALAAIVVAARGFGIHTLLDMHQDVMSRAFCGEGVPLWATRPNVSNFPVPLGAAYNTSAAGVPLPAECAKMNWALGYPAQATGEAFQNLYDNFDGLRDAWAAFWRRTAAVMRPLGDAVLGYELMNEPWAGDVIRDPLLLVPGVADRKNLARMWDAGAAAIREVDAEHAVFFEGVTWDDLGVGFAAVPGGAGWANRSVLSYHYYAPPDVGGPAFELVVRLKDMKRLGCGGMLTEFGVMTCDGCGNTAPTAVMDAADAAKQSWLFWEYKPGPTPLTGNTLTLWNADGTVNHTVAAIVSRTYAQAVAGDTRAVRFDAATGAFFLEYAVARGVASTETRVFVAAAYHYPVGVKVVVGGAAGVTFARTDNGSGLVVTHPAATPIGTTITVNVTNSL